MSTFGSFEIGRRAIHAQQKGAQVTGQNIANANTEGYSRQVVIMKALVPPAAPGVVTPPGYGVAISDITRVKSEFYGDQLMKALTSQSYWDRMGQTLGGIEVIFQEPGETGINISLNEFFDAWQELSVNPESFAARISLREQANTLTSVVRDINNRLDELKFDVEKEVEASLKQVNSLAKEITELNKKIVYLQALGQKSNEMLDERDLRLQELSQLLDIRVLQKDNGSVEVLAGGRILLHDDRYFPLEMKVNNVTQADDTVIQEIQIFNKSGSMLSLEGGGIAGMVESYNRVFPQYQGKLNELVYNLVIEVNKIHQEGFGLDGVNDRVFFQIIDENDKGRAAFNFYVDDGILKNLNHIAAAFEDGANPLDPDFEAPGPGNGINALQIARLREALVMEDKNATFHDFFRGMIVDLGVEGRETQRMSLSMRTVAERMREQQESVSGVSLDDEMLNLIQYQHAYNAASRYLSVLDQMLGVLIDEIGR
ncbi:MAG: flagellar hook-associated protein FlgK [Bacillota bacterium]|nr:flagellar hook-associated protein FlgK [Bacillota bacterium]